MMAHASFAATSKAQPRCAAPSRLAARRTAVALAPHRGGLVDFRPCQVAAASNESRPKSQAVTLPEAALLLAGAAKLAVIGAFHGITTLHHPGQFAASLLLQKQAGAKARVDGLQVTSSSGPVSRTLQAPELTSEASSSSALQSSVAAATDAPIFVTSISHWTALNASAAASGLLLATVFVSDKAMAAHGALLDRLRQRFGSSCRFAFVRIGDGFHQRNAAARSGSPCAPGPLQQLLRGRPGSPAEAHLSCLAASHGLDVALCALLPDGVRAFPSLLLTAGVEVAGATRWGAVTRVGEMAQLVSDWDHVNRRFATALQEARARQQLAQLEMDAWAADGKTGFEVLPRQGAVAAKVENEVQRVWAGVLA